MFVNAVLEQLLLNWFWIPHSLCRIYPFKKHPLHLAESSFVVVVIYTVDRWQRLLPSIEFASFILFLFLQLSRWRHIIMGDVIQKNQPINVECVTSFRTAWTRLSVSESRQSLVLDSGNVAPLSTYIIETARRPTFGALGAEVLRLK